MRTFAGFEKGINLGGWLSQSTLEKEHLETFITQKDIETIKAVGADHVRLPIDYMLIEKEDGTPVEEGYDYIDRCVRWCEECGLKMILDLHRTAGYSFDEAKDCGSFFEDVYYQNRFLALWDRLAARYGKYDFIAFDLLNEIVDPEVSAAWNSLAAQAIIRIRMVTKNTWILIGGTCYNSINTVKNIMLPPDEKIVYSFHFYEPYIFTHQAAYWQEGMPSDFRVEYPLKAGEYRVVSAKKLDGNFAGIVDKMGWDVSGKAMISALFKEAVEVARERNVPLYCGEYGVIDLADTKYAIEWYRDMHAVFKKYKIGRAIWTWKKKDFGITDEHYKDIYEEMITLL